MHCLTQRRFCDDVATADGKRETVVSCARAGLPHNLDTLTTLITSLVFSIVRYFSTSSSIQLFTSSYTHFLSCFHLSINSFVHLFIFINISSFTDFFILLSSFHFPSFILSFSVYSSASILHFFIYSLLQCDGMGIPRGESCNPHQTSHKPTIMVRRRTAQWRTLSFAQEHPR